MRHSKAQKENFSNDFERVLTAEGINRINFLYDNYLNNFNLNIDLIITSSAKRTLETAKLMKDKLRLKADIKKFKNIYSNNYEQNYDYFFSLDEHINSVLFVAHNPAISDMASNFLHEDIYLKTASIIAFEFDILKWEDLFLKNPKCIFSII